MLIKLTNAHPDKDVKGQPIWISMQHIVSVRPNGAGCGILTVAGIDYTVAENASDLSGKGLAIDVCDF